MTFDISNMSVKDRMQLESDLHKANEEHRSTRLLEIKREFEMQASAEGYTLAQVFYAGKKVAEPKYRDPQSGKTWSGRGYPPAWIAGRERKEFEVKKE